MCISTALSRRSRSKLRGQRLEEGCHSISAILGGHEYIILEKANRNRQRKRSGHSKSLPATTPSIIRFRRGDLETLKLDLLLIKRLASLPWNRSIGTQNAIVPLTMLTCVDERTRAVGRAVFVLKSGVGSDREGREILTAEIHTPKSRDGALLMGCCLAGVVVVESCLEVDGEMNVAPFKHI